MEYLEGMLQREKDNFSRVCNRLLGTCFLCKGNQNTKADYYFVLKYRKEFKEYLGVLGYRLEINEEYGVIQLTSPRDHGRDQRASSPGCHDCYRKDIGRKPGRTEE